MPIELAVTQGDALGCLRVLLRGVKHGMTCDKQQLFALLLNGYTENIMAMTTCDHVDQIKVTKDHKAVEGCEDCLKIGSTWVHLRMCLTCGHIGCCDSSEHKHARAHHAATSHPIIQSVEPGEKWGWCYVDEDYLREPPAPVA